LRPTNTLWLCTYGNSQKHLIRGRKMKIDIRQEELHALDIVLNKVEVTVKVGMILGLFRTRLQKELNKTREDQLKEQYTPKKKSKK